MKKYKCPCCGNLTLESEGLFDVCSICDWQDDNLQRDDPDFGGANYMTLNEARAAFKKGIPLSSIREAAQKRYVEEVERARKIAELRGEEFLEGEADRWLTDDKDVE